MPYHIHRNCRLHYTVAGKGPNLLLLHGLGSHSGDWSPQIDEFAQHYRVLALDLPGHGRSQRWPDGRDYSLSRFAEDVAAVMTTAGMAQAHVVGLSMGGAVAFQLALTVPARVSSLTIVNSSPSFVILGTARAAFWLRKALVNFLGFKVLGRVLAKKLFPTDPELQAQFRKDFQRNDKSSYRALMKALDGWDVSPQLSEIECPVLVVAADRDYTPVSFKQQYVNALPKARLVVIENAHHAVTAEHPTVFNNCLADFLGSLNVVQEAG